MPKNYILNNIGKISSGKMPVSIVQGRYDVLCPPIQAWLLHKAIPKSRLIFAISGHSSGDPPLTAKLVEEMKRMKRVI